jgi:hypothetical protein
MEIFQKCEGKFDAVAKTYRKSGEAAYISMPIIFENEKYREIVYYKTLLGRPKKEVQGLVFVNENGTVIDDMRLKRELAYIAYKFEMMLSAYRGGLTRAIVKEAEIEKDKRDYDQIIKALEVLKSEGMQGTDIVTEVLTRLPDLKIENNAAILELAEKIKSVEEGEPVLSVEMIQDIEPSYTKALIKNFVKIKLINKGRKYYDELKKASDKKKGKIKYRLSGKGITEGLRKIEYVIGYFRKVLEIYDKITDMSEEKYREFLKNMDKNAVIKRLDMVRN